MLSRFIALRAMPLVHPSMMCMPSLSYQVWETSGCGKLLTVGSYWQWEVTGCTRLLSAGGYRAGILVSVGGYCMWKVTGYGV